MGMSEAQVRHELGLGTGTQLGSSALYARVFEMADREGTKPAPRAIVPRIVLQSSKTTRKLTTEWFANHVAQRYRACLARAGATA